MPCLRYIWCCILCSALPGALVLAEYHLCPQAWAMANSSRVSHVNIDVPDTLRQQNRHPIIDVVGMSQLVTCNSA